MRTVPLPLLCLAVVACGPAGGSPYDRDGDGVTTELDCDDDDASSTVRAEDEDCDGVPTADDCDDADPLVGAGPCGPDDTPGTDSSRDTGTGDTGSDTGPLDTQDTGSGPGGALAATTETLHRLGYTRGDTLAFTGIVVTGRRDGAGTDNWFVAQDPAATTTHQAWAGLHVNVLSADPPEIGALVDVTGIYQEYPKGTQGDFPHYASFGFLEVDTRPASQRPEDGITVQATGTTLPAAVTVPAENLRLANLCAMPWQTCSRADIEKLEGMRVRVEEATPLTVPAFSGVLATYVKMAPAGTTHEFKVHTFFHDLRDELPGVSANDTFTAVEGVLTYFGGFTGEYYVAPTRAGDAAGYVEVP